MEVDGTNFTVVGGREVLGEVVRVVVLPTFPVDGELLLFGPVTKPVETHVNCFGALLFDGVI